MSDFDISFGVTVEGADAAISQIGRVERANERVARSTTQAAQQTSQAAQRSSQAISQLGASAQQMGQRAGQAIGALGNMGAVLASLSPAAGQAGSAIGALGSAVGALSGAMGPLGVGLAAVTTAVGLLGAGFAAQRERLDASREAVERLTTSYDDLAASIQRAMDAQVQRERLERGGGTLAEQRAFTQAARNRADLLQRAVSGDTAAQQELRSQGVIQSGGDPSLLDRVGALAWDLLAGQRAGSTTPNTLSEADRQRLLRELERASAEEVRRASLESLAEARGGAREPDAAVASATSAAAPARRGGGGRAREALANTTDNEAALARQAAEAQIDLAKAYEERRAAEEGLAAKAQELAEQEKERLRAEADAQRERIAAMRELEQAAIESGNAFRESWRGSIDDVISAWQQANRDLRAAGGQMLSTSSLLEVGMTSAARSIADTVGGTMVGAFEQALGAWLDGSKGFVEAAEEMVKGVLKALVIESIVQAVTETARGIADLASYRYDTAALHFAAAAAWAAVGGVAGAVGAGIGAFGGGGGGADKSASATVTPTDASAQQQQSQPTIINVYPGGFITQRDVQAGIVDALNAAAREGARIEPSIVGG